MCDILLWCTSKHRENGAVSHKLNFFYPQRVMFGKKLIVFYVGILSASSFNMPDDDFQYTQNM